MQYTPTTDFSLVENELWLETVKTVTYPPKFTVSYWFFVIYLSDVIVQIVARALKTSQHFIKLENCKRQKKSSYMSA